ncbi:hypothetical protein PIROE2DRAFT_62178 [Piromyces sp. E2]|nr:hypothetical protein PIROE2DRAFT_62178 [Piromyces sp. E2]|eukprot:OUM61974.1 hypothetical protein PIROE2DRAFT_62178 [Piromyces sp. E2]
MDDSLQDNVEYIFDYQTKLSYDLPINTIQLFEIDLSSSILNNDSSIQAINNVQETLSKGFRKLFVSITWDSTVNNWKICHIDKNDKSNNNCIINYNENNGIINLVKSIRKWLDNANECNVVILIFQIKSTENFDKEKTISCMNGYMEKLEILKRDIISEIKDILYTVDMMKKGIYQGKKYEERGRGSISYTNGNWTSFKKLCSMNKKLLIGLESNGLLCQQYKDNILFTDNQLIKKLIQYQDLKKYILFSTPKLSRNNRIDKVIKLVEKRKRGNETTFDSQDIDNNNLSVIFTHDDIINIKKEVVDLINDNNMSIHLKTFDLNSIQLLKNSLIWSWDINTNFMEDSSNSCVVINRVSGSW